jgi:HAD superfamily hydrolase (TIGR01459 family)
VAKILNNLSEISDQFDAVVLDIWGVLHNGEQLYAPVKDSLRELRLAGKKICLLSNAPRRRAMVAESLLRFGLRLGVDFDEIYTSGEATYQALVAPQDGLHKNLGKNYYPLSTQHHAPLLDDLNHAGFVAVQNIFQADFVLATKTLEPGEEPASYDIILEQARARELPMICANPDLVVPIGNQICYCAGSIAARYAFIGGRVAYHGKPHGDVYARVQELLGVSDPKRIFCIGDGLHTDIQGANGVGMTSVFVAGGIHRRDILDTEGQVLRPALNTLLNDSAGKPDYVINELVW